MKIIALKNFGVVTNLHVVVCGPGVKHYDSAIGQDCGGPGPDTVSIEPLIGYHGEGKVEPMDHVFRYGVAPSDVAPYR